jgi:hypothetical protein
MKNPLRINKLLKSGAQSRLLARARLLAQLDAQVQALLAPPLQQHCRVLALREPVLVLAADSPVWAARLRFHAPHLVRQISLPQSMRLRSIRVRVRPPEPSATTTPRRPAPRLGQRGAAAMQQAAENISDPELKTSLLKLASRRTGR